MSFLSHVDEMRERLMKSLLVFMLGFFLCFFLATEYVLEFLRAPLFEIMPPEQQKLYFTSLFENFLTHLKIAGYSSIFLCSPFFFYQAWAFIVPGLQKSERKYVVPFVFAATFFFLGGAAFAYYVLFPVAFKFFVTFGAEIDTPILTIDSYYSTCLKLLFLFGLSFELPVFVSLLGLMGVLDGKTLREHRRTAIIIITILCAMFAPPDAISMLVLMGPLILMYEGAIYVVDWIGPGRKKSRKKRQK